MKARSLAVALSVLALSPVFAQEKAQQPAAPSPADMEAAMKAMSPGESHKHLAWYAGEWTMTNRMWMDPGQPPLESSGTMKGELILGGRFVQTHWQGTLMGMPFEGRGIEGYDNMTRQYVNSWVDNMRTGILNMTGTCEDGGKKCSMKGDMIDPMTGKPSYMRTVTTWMDQNSFKWEMFAPGPDGKEVKGMEMIVKRKG